MAELIAVGKGSHRQSRHEIHDGDCVLVGRAPRNGWGIPWDRLISREHARVRLDAGTLVVQQLETARNPVFFDGKPAGEFSINADESFRIGETTFYFRTDPTRRPGDSIITEHLFDDAVGVPFANPVSCLQTLCKMPGIIADSATNEEFAERVVDLLLESLRGSLAAAVMQFDGVGEDAASEPRLLRWSSRTDQVLRFRPSRRLIRRAFERGRSVVHLWLDDHETDEESNFTMNDDLDWAFCTPITVAANQRWCLYVSGKRRFAGLREVRSAEDLIGELRLAELMAGFVGAVRRVRSLEQQQTEMRQFFSPAVVETLVGSEPGPAGDALEPRLGPVSVLFCDVRGFSRKVEEAGENLQGLLEQVSEALTVMTRSILKYEGVIADFQGDATLGFWGWPRPAPDAALLACRAALRIHRLFEEASRDPRSPLHGFRIGIGVTFGEAIAGRIGSHEQIKVGVFGPVVNLASRLQDLTKQLGASILVDAGVVEEVGGTLSASEACFRRLARLRPPGMENSTDVYSLAPTGSESRLLTVTQLETYDAAVEAVIAGDWPAAEERLELLPASDPPSAFLRSLLASANHRPPEDWDGALSMAGKGELRLRSN
ncbi:MAG: adenylate/guanylate cyclase domain-containing protein [Planctomycetota bacterium]